MCIFISKTIETAQGYPVDSFKQLKLLQQAPRLYLNWTPMIATESHCSNNGKSPLFLYIKIVKTLLPSAIFYTECFSKCTN